MNMQPGSDAQNWADLEEFMLHVAVSYRHTRRITYLQQTPKQLHRDLCRIDKAVQSTLQTLLSLDLSHREGQDLEIQTFNSPLVQALQSSRITLEIFRSKGPPEPSFEVPTYPTKLVTDLMELRDSARHAAASLKPLRGQSVDRDSDSRDASQIAKNLVFHFRARFGFMPAISTTGPVVNLLVTALDKAGLKDFDAARILRTAIERDEVGRQLLPSAKAIRSGQKRAK